MQKLEEITPAMKWGEGTTVDFIRVEEYKEKVLLRPLNEWESKFETFVRTNCNGEERTIKDYGGTIELYKEIGRRWPSLHTRLEELLVPIPFTHLELHLEQPKAYFYYFTDESFRAKESKYRMLDEALVFMGSYRRDVVTITITRERIPAELWDAILKGLNIRNYPALVVSQESLGIEKLELGATSYQPPPIPFAKWESGFIGDVHLQDRDTLNKFLNELYDAAKEGMTEQALRKQTIIEVLKCVGKEVKDLLKQKL